MTHSTDDLVPRDLRAAILRQASLPRDVTWQPLSGGRTNRVWRLGDGSDALICKLYAREQENPLYPNLPGLEFETLKMLEPLGISPAPVALLHTPVGDALLYRYLDGRLWRSGVGAVAGLLARLHATRPGIPLRSLPTGSAELLAQCAEIQAQCGALPEALQNLPPDPGVAALEAPVFVHTDVVVSNLVSTPNGLCLIDWQCPALGDPCEDMASFLSPAMQHLYGGPALSDADRRDFLDAYGNTDMVGRYRKLAPLYHFRIAIYCQWKAERGDEDYAWAMALEVAQLSRYSE